MTDFDKELIEKAENTSRWRYRDIDDLIDMAETKQAREILINIRWTLYDSVHDTL